MAAAKQPFRRRVSSKMSTNQAMPTLPGACEDTSVRTTKVDNVSETERTDTPISTWKVTVKCEQTDTPINTLNGRVKCEVCGGQCPATGLCMAAVDVATGWMLDFVFRCLCQHFKQQHMEDFEQSRDAMEALLQGVHKLEFQQLKTVRLCQFLSRVAEGRNIDAQFEKDDKITPLEAALLIWESIEGEPESFGNLHEEIQLLVQVQAVSVCMEKGQYKQATEVLERVFGRADSNKSIQMKLSMIISNKDPCHWVLQGFTYEQMLKKIKSYIDIFLSEMPKNFLLKVATKVVEAKREPPEQFDENKNDIAMESKIKCEEEKRNMMEEVSFETELLENEAQIRVHKRRISTEVKKESSPEQQLSFKNPSAKSNEHDHRSGNCWRESKKESSTPEFKRRRFWRPEEDEQLKKGVKEFGVGNWKQILLHYNFVNRTGVMLKDRWRTMERQIITARKRKLY